MTQRYLGGIITANPTEPSSNLSNASASGMWTLQEALSFYRAGDWPDPDLRLPANRPLASNLDLRRVATDGRYISEAC